MTADDNLDAVRTALTSAANRADAVADAGPTSYRERVAATVRRTFGVGDRYAAIATGTDDTLVYDRENHDAWIKSTVAVNLEGWR